MIILFKFSIIIAVYNSEEYLEETIQSLISQDFGFDGIEVILVNDGSTDNSGKLCQTYSNKYQNIKTINKANGGVSSARNEGLNVCSGEYISFLDSDDLYSADALSKVYEFFEKNKEKTDVVCIPRKFFDRFNGEHALNYKFEQGNRVIDLDQEYFSILNSVGSAFIKSTIATSHRFDTNMTIGEDAKYILEVLDHKHTLGVVSGCIQWYRKRQSENSAVDRMYFKKDYYLNSLNRLIDPFYCKYSYDLPKFIQFSIMYDIQWRIKNEHIPSGLLSDDEMQLHISILKKALHLIDDEIILSQKNIWTPQKLFALQLKYNYPSIRSGNDYVTINYSGKKVHSLSLNALYIDHISVINNKLEITGRYTEIPQISNIDLWVGSNGRLYLCEKIRTHFEEYSLDHIISIKYGFKTTIPLEGENELAFYYVYHGTVVECKKIRTGKFCPLNWKRKYLHYYSSGFEVYLEDWHLEVCFWRTSRVIRNELYAFCIDSMPILKKIKTYIIRWSFPIIKKRLSKKIWLLSDRIGRADDNGEVLFDYLNHSHVSNIKFQFAISKVSSDYKAKRYRT